MGANFAVSWELLRLRRGEKRSMTDETTGDVLDHALPFRLLRGDSVLIVGKWKDREVEEKVLEVANWLWQTMDIKVIRVGENIALSSDRYPGLSISLWSSLSEEEKERTRLVVCMGGDGTLLYANTLFPFSSPPIISFGMGSLGFLTRFDVNEYHRTFHLLSEGLLPVVPRTRLDCTVLPLKDKPESRYVVLNDCTMDRGLSGRMCCFDTLCNDKNITTVIGDGVILATSTGSTAYNLSAGGSMVHPQLPAILFTPLCPHSLSFRPVVLPSTVVLRITNSQEWGEQARVFFDGRNPTFLDPGDTVIIRLSSHPLNTVSESTDLTDWFTSLGDLLNWNVRKRQKPLGSL